LDDTGEDSLKKIRGRFYSSFIRNILDDPNFDVFATTTTTAAPTRAWSRNNNNNNVFRSKGKNRLNMLNSFDMLQITLSEFIVVQRHSFV